MLSVHKLQVELRGQAVLRGINANFCPGVLSVLIGPNGAGKTTLLRSLAGLATAPLAQVCMSGQSLAGFSRRERARLISWCPELLLYSEGFRVDEVVQLGRFPLHGGRPGDKDWQVIAEVLAALSLTQKRSALLTELSSGELRKVMIARALAQEAPVLLFDEPCANLDIGASLQVMSVLQTLARQGRTVVTSMHDLFLARKFGEKIFVLADGAVLVEGTSEEVFAEAVLAKVFGVKDRSFFPS